MDRLSVFAFKTMLHNIDKQSGTQTLTSSFSKKSSTAPIKVNWQNRCITNSIKEIKINIFKLNFIGIYYVKSNKSIDRRPKSIVG